jgi:hypothetical protein
MRKALVVGIDYYKEMKSLHGCVNDARAVRKVLERNGDGTVNFDVEFRSGTGPEYAEMVTRGDLKDAVRELFADDCDVALFYFAGHGHVDETGGFLCTSDSLNGDDGFALTEALRIANGSRAKNKVIILDSCFSGIAGDVSLTPNTAELSQGLTILAASTEKQYATERNGSGVFTTLLVDAMNGAASNLVGEVTPGSVYAHIDQSLGPWKQRPVFKTNVKNFVSLRKVHPPILLADLQRITEFFPKPGAEFKLDPTFEPERSPGDAERGVPPPIPENTRKFAILQKYARVNLVVPVDAPHMWHAAMNSKSCKLTVLGEHYRRLREDERI